MELELETGKSLETMRQKAETERLQMKEEGSTTRKHMELQVRREDIQTKAQTAVHDTHVKAVTAHDVAEINVTGKILDTHVAQKYNIEATKESLKDADKAFHATE